MTTLQKTNARHMTHTYTLERPRYRPHQIITDMDMTLGVHYAQEKLRQHNRLLHGWGIICGLEVESARRYDESKWDATGKVLVRAGYALDPMGNMLWVPRDIVVDIRDDEMTGDTLNLCGEQIDPWRSDVKRERTGDRDLYLAVRYHEYEGRPVRKAPGGCGCGDSDCENSRIYESYAIRVLTNLPKTYPDNPLVPPTLEPSCPPSCPPDCPTDPWVILAVARVDDSGKVEIRANTDDLRRYVLSFADFFYTCKQGTTPGDETEIPLDKGLLWEMLDDLFNDEVALELFREQPDALLGLHAISLTGVTRTSKLGETLVPMDMSLRKIGEMTDREAFIHDLVVQSGVNEANRKNFERQAGEVWKRARRAVKLVEALIKMQ